MEFGFYRFGSSMRIGWTDSTTGSLSVLSTTRRHSDRSDRRHRSGGRTPTFSDEIHFCEVDFARGCKKNCAPTALVDELL